MKVAIGYNIVSGPWGGGNRFVISISEALENAGHKVVFELRDTDIDIILMIDPRKNLKNIPFGPGKILKYLSSANPNAIVVHRINECDERKGTKTVNFKLRLSNYVADHTVFVGTWLQNLNVTDNVEEHNNTVILNGGDPKIFNRINANIWDNNSPLKLVTHHWSGNWMKGFDIYKKIDDMLATDYWKQKIEFTYIGNIPKNFEFNNSTHIPPLNGKALSRELKNNHVYVTASQNEPGGNHQNEAILCGLPIIYRNSGSLPEYCESYGLQFNNDRDFEICLLSMLEEYQSFRSKNRDYPHVISTTITSYLTLFEALIHKRPEIVGRRKIHHSKIKNIANRLFF